MARFYHAMLATEVRQRTYMSCRVQRNNIYIWHQNNLPLLLAHAIRPYFVFASTHSMKTELRQTKAIEKKYLWQTSLSFSSKQVFTTYERCLLLCACSLFECVSVYSLKQFFKDWIESWNLMYLIAKQARAIRATPSHFKEQKLGP